MQKSRFSCRSCLVKFNPRLVKQTQRTPTPFRLLVIPIHDKRSFVKKLRLHSESDATWNMATAQTITSERRVIHSSLPEFSPMGTVAWYMHVATLSNVHYDIVIEDDLLERLQINFKSITSTLEWEGLEIPMRLQDVILGDI